MPKNVPPFEVTCPCCNAVLKVDAEIKGVIAHTAAVKPKMFADIEEAARAMKEQDTRRDSTHFGVVTNHRSPASCQTNVELKTVAAMLEGKVERGKSILGDPRGQTRTAMAEEEGRGHGAF